MLSLEKKIKIAKKEKGKIETKKSNQSLRYQIWDFLHSVIRIIKLIFRNKNWFLVDFEIRLSNWLTGIEG